MTKNRKKYHKKWYKENKERLIVGGRKYRAGHKENCKKRELRRGYGLTLTDYNKKFIEQDGVCAICKMPETHIIKGKLTMLSIDHDHKTNKVRGLLCRKCNCAIGLLGEDVTRILNSARYLKEWES